MPTQINTKKSELTTNNQSVAVFKIAFKGLITSLNGHEFQQIDGTEYLTKSDEEKIRPLLRTHVSLALAQDMVIR
jgi:virulence-associated protein VapD